MAMVMMNITIPARTTQIRFDLEGLHLSADAGDNLDGFIIEFFDDGRLLGEDILELVDG
jgi:hypothetical protein